MRELPFTLSQIISGIIISILLILFSKVGSFEGLYSISSSLTYKFQSDSLNFFTDLKENVNFAFNLRNFKEDRDRLRKDIIEKDSKIAELTQIIQEKQIMDDQKIFRSEYKLVGVRITKYNNLDAGEVFISKGSSSGLKVGDILIYKNYAIGEIVEVMTSVSRVKLIISPKSTIGVITLQNRTKGVVTGSSSKKILMEEVLIDDYLNEGDQIVTSGINSSYPYGLLIGEVSKIYQIESEYTKSADIKTPILFSELVELFVIIK